MIRNIKLRLIDNKERWLWIDNNVVSDAFLYRFFKALRDASTIEEQIENIQMVTKNNGRNNKATETLHYSYKSNIVEVFVCNYNAKTDNYARGKKIDEFKIN